MTIRILEDRPAITELEVITPDRPGLAKYPYYIVKMGFTDGKVDSLGSITRSNFNGTTNSLTIGSGDLRRVAELLVEAADEIEKIEQEGRRVVNNPVPED
jgi:hypothetical protein